MHDSARRCGRCYLVQKIMQLAFEEYRNIDVPSSALNESIGSIENSMKYGFEKALLIITMTPLWVL